MRLIAQQVAALKAKGDKGRSFHLLFTPRRRMICERVLEEANVYDGTNFNYPSIYALCNEEISRAILLE